MARISAAQRVLNHQRLLDAAAALITERGYEAVSLCDVSERAGFARTAIYNYVEDKAELLIAATDRSSAPMREAIAEVAGDDTRSASQRLDTVLELMLGSFTHDARNLMLLRAVHGSLGVDQRSRALAPFRNDLGAQLARILQDGTDSGEYQRVSDPALRLDLVFGVLVAAVEKVLAEPAAADRVIISTSHFLCSALGGSSPLPSAVSSPVVSLGRC